MVSSKTLVAASGFGVLVASPRHVAVLAQTTSEFPDIGGNVMQDLPAAVWMRDRGISRS